MTAPAAAQRAPQPMTAGLYNKHSELQNNMNRSALPALVDAAVAAANSAAAEGRPSIAIADFGCSEGKNSVAALSAAADAALAAGGAAVDVVVTHIDLPANNWAATAAAVAAAPAYGANPRVAVALRPVATGFYEACFPPASLDVVYSSATYHWASGAGLPATLACCGVSPHNSADAAVRGAAAAAAAADWETCLAHRAVELRPGGRFVASNVVDPVGGPLEPVWAAYFSAWRSLRDDGTITPAECAAAVVRAHRRSVDDWLAPLRAGGAAAAAFRVVAADTVSQVAPAYTDLRAGAVTPAEYGRWVSRFFEAVARGAFVGALVDAGRAQADADAVVDEYYSRMAADVAAAPAPPAFVMDNLVLVLERV